MRNLPLSLFVIAACGPSPFQRNAFEMGNDLMHTVHEEAFLRDGLPLPQSYSYRCPDGGSVEMVATSTDITAGPISLFHELRGCQADGVTMAGQLDYLDIRACTTGGFEITVEGSLQFAGGLEGTCVYQSRENCDGAFEPDHCQ